MNTKVLDRLYNIAKTFIGQELVNVAVIKKSVTKDIMVAELTFKDKADVRRIAVLVLDQDLTQGDYKEIAEELTR